MVNWLLFALIPPAFYGVSNFLDKFLIEKKVKDPIIVTIFGGVPTFFMGLFILLINGFPTIGFGSLLLIIFSGVLLELYLVPYFMALSVDDASRVIPLFQFIPIFVLFLSFAFLGETLKSGQFLGFLFILGGAFVLGVRKVEGKLFKLRKSLYLMLLSSFLYSLTVIIFKFIAIKESFWITIAYEFFGVTLGALLLLIIPKYRERFIHDVKQANPQIWGILSLNECIVVLAQLSGSFALLLAPIALVSVIGSTQPLFVLTYGVILSVWFPHIIKEDLQKSTILVKFAAIILIIIGVYVINPH